MARGSTRSPRPDTPLGRAVAAALAREGLSLPRQGNKFNAVRQDGFDSRAEARRYAELSVLARAGQITDLRRQVRYPLEVNGVLVATYVADFVYREAGREVVEDVKSPPTRRLAAYRMKRALMRALYGIALREVG